MGTQLIKDKYDEINEKRLRAILKNLMDISGTRQFLKPVDMNMDKWMEYKEETSLLTKITEQINTLETVVLD